MSCSTTSILDALSAFDGTHPWINLIGWTGTLVAIPLAFYFYFKSLKEKKPAFKYVIDTVFEKNSTDKEKLDVLFDEVSIKTLTVVKFRFGNIGRDTILKQNIANADPLYLEFEGDGKILEKNIIYCTNTANAPSISSIYDPIKIPFTFDYLDNGNYFEIKVFFAGSIKSIKVCGTIIGSKEIKNLSNEGHLKEESKLISILWSAFPPLVFMLIGWPSKRFWFSPFTITFAYLVLIIFLCIFCNLLAGWLYRETKNYLTKNKKNSFFIPL